MNIIFCFDGTKNSHKINRRKDQNISNVLKLHLLFGGDIDNSYQRYPSQRSFYFSGVGTRGNWFKRTWNALFAPADGERKIILEEARKAFNSVYKPGDKVYIFGFSRGAALARIFASKRKCDVEFLGVFDTVAAIKGSRDFKEKTYPSNTILFENGDIAPHIKKAVHCVSVDENRLVFQPTLFNEDERVEEVWFAGAHSDIGGGFNKRGLSDITLDFMRLRINNNTRLRTTMVYGLEEELIGTDLRISDMEVAPNELAVDHVVRRFWPFNRTLHTRKIRVQEGESKPKVHDSVIQRIFKKDYKPENVLDVIEKFNLVG